MGGYRILDDYDFLLECCSDIVNGYNTHIGLVCNVFSNTVVDLSVDEVTKKVRAFNRSRIPRVGEMNEGLLDKVERTDSRTSAQKLADRSFRNMVSGWVENMVKNR